MSLIREAIGTEDGRRFLSDALRGSVPGFPTIEVPIESPVGEYPELGQPPNGSAAGAPAPVFITGRFRSGSTLLWNIFRHVDGCRAYYEPLNERRWFDPSRRGSRVDATHIGVSDYWREYEGLEHLGRVFRDDWNTRHLYMDESAWDPDLGAYINGLIEASGTSRAVLQFNRVDFRLPWLRRWFSRAFIVHIYRHPRDQWCSALVDLTAFPKHGQLADFEAHDHFYLLAWVRDLRHRFPVLDERTVAHPYELFYLLWKLSWLYGRHYADYSIGLERLIADPDHELRTLLAGVGLADVPIATLCGLIAEQSKSRWQAYADDAWFAERESKCEALLQTWAGAASPAGHVRRNPRLQGPTG